MTDGSPRPVLLRIASPDAATDLASLRGWLADVPELRGRVDEVHSPPPAGALGPVLDALQVAAVPGGAVTLFATALVTWLQHRDTDVTVRVERDGRTVELDAKRVRALDVDGVRRVIEAAVHAIEEPAESAGRTDGGPPGG